MEDIIGVASAGKRATAVYSPEMKLALVREYASDGQGATRAQFARSKGIPPGTFDGWYWKYGGIDRGHAREAAQREAAPIDVTDALRKGMREALSSAPEKSQEWAAASYFCSMEGGLMAFMDDGALDCDNNAAERSCKKVAMERLNFLFVQSERGGQSAAVALTLIEI